MSRIWQAILGRGDGGWALHCALLLSTDGTESARGTNTMVHGGTMCHGSGRGALVQQNCRVYSNVTMYSGNACPSLYVTRTLGGFSARVQAVRVGSG